MPVVGAGIYPGRSGRPSESSATWTVTGDLTVEETDRLFGSHASFTAYAYADRLMGDLLTCLKESGLADRTTILVTTDHGFKKVKKLIRDDGGGEDHREPRQLHGCDRIDVSGRQSPIVPDNRS